MGRVQGIFPKALFKAFQGTRLIAHHIVIHYKTHIWMSALIFVYLWNCTRKKSASLFFWGGGIFGMHSKKETVPPVNPSVAYFMCTLASLHNYLKAFTFSDKTSNVCQVRHTGMESCNRKSQKSSSRHESVE